MKVPVSLSDGFGDAFEQALASTCVEAKLISAADDLRNRRFLNRSVVPHVQRLTELFNRLTSEDASEGLEKYWKKGSNPENLRLAYFLSFMPGNLYRVASVWSELARLGFKWPQTQPALRAVEFGAGPATASSGVLAGEKHAPLGLPQQGNFALIEQDRQTLQLGERWFSKQAAFLGLPLYETRPFHRKLEPAKGWLPRQAPKFNLWLMSYVLNEFEIPPKEIARTLLEAWDRHLEDDGLVILVEPALRLQSRKMLEVRKEILALDAARADGAPPRMQLLLPCLGHQACGALADAEDWCHEEVSWWRPPYLRVLDELTGLDRKTLPFSYQVWIKSQKPRDQWLPELKHQGSLHRLVSPAFKVGPDWEFYWCGEEGKRRLRTRSDGVELERGSILVDAAFRGDKQASRIDGFKRSL